MKIYIRSKNADGQWRYCSIDEGRGMKTGHLVPPFFVRPFINGKQLWRTLEAQTYPLARKEADTIEAAITNGLPVPETDATRILITRAVADFIEESTRTKKKKTVAGYRLNLQQFIDSTSARYLDQITKKTLCEFRNHLAASGYEARTQHNRVITVLSLLKEFKIATDFSLGSDLPKFETEPAVPFSDDELHKLFAAMDIDESDCYYFFLGSGCREQEVTFATWTDIDWQKQTYTVRRKTDAGFTPKNHESRTIPLPGDLMTRLKARKKRFPNAQWIFLNEDGQPDKHLLRKFKRIAFRAGLNCGHCETTITKGRATWDSKRKIVVTCATDPVCAKVFLHRLRKTCATRWQRMGIPINDIRIWLGHKNLNTTQIYLGSTPTDRLRDKIDGAFIAHQNLAA